MAKHPDPKHHQKGAAVLETRHAPRRTPVKVEYPKHQEIVESPIYTFHIVAIEEPAGVELSIDDGDWLSCREALGLYWFDWGGYGPGEHRVVARIRTPEGDLYLSEPRLFTVRLS